MDGFLGLPFLSFFGDILAPAGTLIIAIASLLSARAASRNAKLTSEVLDIQKRVQEARELETKVDEIIARLERKRDEW